MESNYTRDIYLTWHDQEQLDNIELIELELVQEEVEWEELTKPREGKRTQRAKVNKQTHRVGSAGAGEH